jgi:hypothetical protein
MAFVRVFRRTAAITSGGVTRRAATALYLHASASGSALSKSRTLFRPMNIDG